MNRYNQSSENIDIQPSQKRPQPRRLSLTSPISKIKKKQIKSQDFSSISIDQSLSKSVVENPNEKDANPIVKRMSLSASKPAISPIRRKSRTSTQTGVASQIKVIVRFRPLNSKELQEYKHQFTDLVQIPQGQLQTCYVYGDLYEKLKFQTYTVDHIFSPEAKQEEIFEIIGKCPIIDILNGYNSTIFAYGQTGSGKTYTMLGPNIYNLQNQGLIPRSSQEIFKMIQEKDNEDIEFTLICSMVEIYQERLKDLLDPNNDKTLTIKESPLKGIYIDQLTEISVINEEEILEVLEMGEQMRTVGSTQMNEKSSRSHSLFILEVRQKLPDDNEKIGKLNLVDLAGSEKIKKSKAIGIGLEEAKKINLSLSALGNVIHALTTGNDHIPYRDSKLTRLLQESLGGNYKTTLLTTCSPHINNVQETMSTLSFATRAKTIKNLVKVNMKTSTAQLQLMIKELKKELFLTKKELEKYKTLQNDTSQISEQTNLTSFLDTSSNISACKFYSPNLQLLPPSGTKNYQAVKRNMQIQSFSLNLNETQVDITSIENTKVENTKAFQQQTEESFLESEVTFKKKYELLQNKYKDLELQLQDKDSIIETLQENKKDLQIKFQQSQDNIELIQKEMLKEQEKISKVKSKYEVFKTRFKQEEMDKEHMRKKIQILTTQVNQLTETLSNYDQNYFKQLSERQKKLMADGKMTFGQIDLQEFLQKLQKPENQNQHYASIALDCVKFLDLPAEQDELSINESLNNTQLNETTLETKIFELKRLLAESGFHNIFLRRIAGSLEWRIQILTGKVSIKDDLIKRQKEQITILEKLVKKLRENQDLLEKRVQTIEESPLKSKYTQSPVKAIKSKILRPFKNYGRHSQIQELFRKQKPFESPFKHSPFKSERPLGETEEEFTQVQYKMIETDRTEDTSNIFNDMQQKGQNQIMLWNEEDLPLFEKMKRKIKSLEKELDIQKQMNEQLTQQQLSSSKQLEVINKKNRQIQSRSEKLQRSDVNQ